MNNLTMKIKVQVLIIEALKLCYGFLKLSCYIKESKLEFDKTLKGIVFPRRHGSFMPKFPQRAEKSLDCSLLALYLSYASGFCCYFWRARRIYLPFTLFVFWQAYRVCVGSVLAFEVLLISHHEEQGVERCSGTLTYPHVPSLDGGCNSWMNSWEQHKLCWIYLDNINMLYFFR